jgi:hypothetical protein
MPDYLWISEVEGPRGSQHWISSELPEVLQFAIRNSNSLIFDVWRAITMSRIEEKYTVIGTELRGNIPPPSLDRAAGEALTLCVGEKCDRLLSPGDEVRRASVPPVHRTVY